MTSASIGVRSGHAAGLDLVRRLKDPALLLLPAGLDWRWLSNRDDTPWYPTLELIRQRSPGDWQGVAERVVGHVAARAAGRAA